MVKFTLTSDAITVIDKGKSYTVARGSVNFDPLRSALFEERWDDVPELLTTRGSLEKWARGEFKVSGDTITFRGEKLPDTLAKRALAMATANEDPTPIFKFWERLQENPSWRSVQQLWPFLEHAGIPFTAEGKILTYKAVKRDLMDCHTGTIKNEIGSVHQMPRNKISDDPNEACHFGFHVGALGYAKSFGPSDRQLIICEVDPKDVVCVPYDSSAQKMRVCEYKVVGFYGSDMSSTVQDDEGRLKSEPEPDDDDLDDDAPKDQGAAPKAKILTDDDLTSSTLDGMDEMALLQISLSALRAYAAGSLKIVGASKIPGGKLALVDRIMQVRPTVKKLK